MNSNVAKGLGTRADPEDTVVWPYPISWSHERSRSWGLFKTMKKVKMSLPPFTSVLSQAPRWIPPSLAATATVSAELLWLVGMWRENSPDSHHCRWPELSPTSIKPSWHGSGAPFGSGKWEKRREGRGEDMALSRDETWGEFLAGLGTEKKGPQLLLPWCGLPALKWGGLKALLLLHPHLQNLGSPSG